MKLTLELHDVKKELPDKSCKIAFVAVDESNGKIACIMLMPYSAKHKCFNVHDWETDEEAAETAIGNEDDGATVYWSYLPDSLMEVTETKEPEKSKVETCRERLAREHPDISTRYAFVCPSRYGYAGDPNCAKITCTSCWDRPVEDNKAEKDGERN